jgi:hypothetical protein
MRHECVHLPKIDVLTGEPAPHDLFVETQHFPTGQPQSLAGAGYRVSRRIPNMPMVFRNSSTLGNSLDLRCSIALKIVPMAVCLASPSFCVPMVFSVPPPHPMRRRRRAFHRRSTRDDFHFSRRYGDSKDKSYKKQSLVVSAQHPWFRAVFSSKLSCGAHMASK